MKKSCFSSNLKSQISNFEVGQTLIETLAALFILTMGISAAVGLAVYAFNTSTSITKDIIATGLAREGLEAVVNMRDTNWLADTLSVNGCYDFVSSSANHANCYTHWLNQTYCLDPNNTTTGACSGSSSGNTYFLGSDSTQPNYWVLTKTTSNYGLNFDSANAGNSGFYYPGTNGVSCTSGTSGYCRKIVIITSNSQAPYNQDPNLILVEVKSEVWWTDKKCPAVNTPSAGSCSVELDTYLTNWKNY